MVAHTRAARLNWLTALLIFILQSKSGVVSAAISPDSIAGVETVTAEQLIELANTSPELIIIDARIRGDLKNGYIEDSINLPDIDTDCKSLANIINHKNIPSLFYCNGIKCGRSAKAVKVALGCGYKSLYWFRGGFEEWSEKGYPYLRK